MPGSTRTVESKVIVIPRPLEGFFYPRLSEHYASRDDIKVVVDRAQAVIVSRENGWI